MSACRSTVDRAIAGTGMRTSDGRGGRGGRDRRVGRWLGALALALAAGAARSAEPVLADGVSHLDASFGRMKVQVDLQAREHAVATLALRVDGFALVVPPAAIANVADPSSFELARRDDGLMELRIAGVDAGAPASAVIVFDRLAVRERRTLDAATGAVKQAMSFGAPDLLD